MNSETISVFYILMSIVALIVLAMAVLLTISEWKILTKAGEKGWKSLIPFYNLFVSHHIVGMSHIWFIAEMVIWFIESVLAMFIVFPQWFEVAFLIITTVFTIVSELVHINRLCNCFGKGRGFKIGMFFIPYLFSMIIAFGSARYTPPERKH